MNTSNTIVELTPNITSDPSPGLTPPEPAPPRDDLNDPAHSLRTGRRRTGKIASLPKTLRDRVNHMLDDGVTYPRIIETLGPDGQHLTIDNLSEWKSGGFQDWLNDQLWRDQLLSRKESFSGLADADPVALPEDGLQLATLGACELLRDLSRLGASGPPDPADFVRTANALSRLSRSILQLQQYRDAITRENAVNSPRKKLRLKDELTDEDYELLSRKMDQAFGIRRRPHQPSTTTAA